MQKVIFSLFTILLLSSCAKNNTDLPVDDNTELSIPNQPSPIQMKNGLVAVPFEETVFIPCANDGAGEEVSITGTTNFVYQMNWNDRGFNLVYHENSRHITGTGSSSGETFVGSEGTNGTVMGAWTNNQWIGTTIQQMKLIGRNTSYIVRYKYHLVVTPDGVVTVNMKEQTIDCTK